MRAIIQSLAHAMTRSRSVTIGPTWLHGIGRLGRDAFLFAVFCGGLGLLIGWFGEIVNRLLDGRLPSIRGALLILLVSGVVGPILYFIFPKKLLRWHDEHAWLTRLCQTLDRAEASWLGSQSDWSVQTLQKLDHYLGGWRGLLAICILFVLSGGFASIFHTNLASRSFWSLCLSFFLLFAALGLSFINTWFGYRKYQGRLRRWLLITAVSCIPLLLILSPDFQAGFLDGLKGDQQGSLEVAPPDSTSQLFFFGVFLFSVLLIPIVAIWRNRQHDEEISKLKLEAEHERLERQLSDSRLKLLQAQIEPHFLFNTLGAVQQAAEDKAPEAAQLTGNLIRFLRGSLAQLRSDAVSLQDEQRFISAYLDIMQARMGTRLSYQVQFPPELLHTMIPPTMLITLVENAIKHGLEPKPSGGEIIVSAVRQENQLLLTVADTGCGISEVGGGGVGLENIRERLRLSFADAASLELEMNEPAGFIASIRLPLHDQKKTRSEEETV